MKAVLVIIFAVGFAVVSATPVQEVRYIYSPSQCPEDPKIVPPGPFNLTLHPLFDLAEGSSHQGIVIAGVSGIVTDVSIIIITLTVNARVEIPTIDAEFTGHDMSGYIDTRPFTAFPVGNYTGTGNGIAQVRNLNIVASATLFVNIIGNRVTVRLLSVSVFSFDMLCLNLGPDFQIGGNPVDWDDLCANLKARFDADWANTQMKNQLVEKIRVAANVIVEQYTLEELIDLIGGGGPSTGPTPEPVTGPTTAPCKV